LFIVLLFTAAIVVYDITSKDSYDRAKQWIRELQRQGSPNIIIALVGNKLDLADKRQVLAVDAQEYAEENGILFTETSAKTAANVNELFVSIGTRPVGLSDGQRALGPDSTSLLSQPKSCPRRQDHKQGNQTN